MAHREQGLPEYGLLLFSVEPETILSPTLRVAIQLDRKKQAHNGNRSDGVPLEVR